MVELSKTKKLLERTRGSIDAVKHRIKANKEKRDAEKVERYKRQLKELEAEEDRLKTRVALEKQVAEKREAVRRLKVKGRKSGGILEALSRRQEEVKRRRASTPKPKRKKPREDVLGRLYVKS